MDMEAGDSSIYYFIRLNSLLVTHGCSALRNMFKKRWFQVKNAHWNAATDKEELSKLTSTLKLKNIQRKQLLQGDIDCWDITLLGTLLHTQVLRRKDEKEMHKCIDQIIQIRNQLVHHPAGQLSKKEYEQMWKKATTALHTLGEDPQVMEQLQVRLDQVGSNSLGPCATSTASDDDRLHNYQQLKEDANKKVANRQYKEALDLYLQALEIEGLTPDLKAVLYSNLSHVLVELSPTDKEKLHEALQYAKTACLLLPEWWRGYQRKGRVYFLLNKYKKSVVAFDTGLLFNPASAEMQKQRGEAYHEASKQSRLEHLDTDYQPGKSAFKVREGNERHGWNQTPEQIIQLAETLIKTNMPTGYTMLGHAHRDGYGKQQSYEEAARYYGLAARNGDPEGIYNLAKLTSEGRGVEKNLELGFSLLQQAANKPLKNKFTGQNDIGVLAAQNALGNAYLEGAGVQQNTQLGIQWLIKASDNGDYFAQNSLGVLYLNGNGVPLDHKKAVEYFNLSIYNGNCARAMSNLSICYLHGYGVLPDPFKAKTWCQRALENGYMPAEFDLPKIEEEISTWRAQFGDSKPSDLLNDPTGRTIMEDLEKLQSLSLGANCLTKRDKYRFNPAVLLQLSKTSKTAARILEAQFNYFEAFQLLQNRTTSGADLAVDIQVCEHFAYIIERGLEYVILMPAELNGQLRQCVDRVLVANPNMRAAAISLLYIEMSNSERRRWLINYLKKCQQRYPNDAFFHSFLASIYGFAQLWPEGLKEINLALAISPANVQFLYSRAVMLRNLENTEEAIAAYRLFLDKCEVDDRKRPEALYCMAMLHLVKKNLRDNTWRRYYDQASDAEKQQLPFFLPYESASKEMLNLLIRAEQNGAQSPKAEEQKKKKPQYDLRYTSIIVHFRENLLDNFKIHFSDSKYKWKSPIATPPIKSLLGDSEKHNLEKFFISEMDPSKNSIYKGKYIEGTLIEHANPYLSAMSIIKDDNGYIERIAFYNLVDTSNISQMNQKLFVGCRLAIANPYYRVAADGLPIIRVDDPQTISFLPIRYTDLCSYCHVSNDKAKLRECSRCKVVSYCSKECQANDWQRLKHKFVCDAFSSNS